MVRYADSGGLNLAYKVMGDGPVDLLFIPPFFSNLDILDEYPAIGNGLEQLASFSRLIVFDRRGSGLSDRLCGQGTLEEGAQDALAVLDAAGSERAAVLGLNESGSLCALLAATHPTRVTSLILYGTYATTVRRPDYPWAPTVEEREQQVAGLIAAWGMEGLAGTINPSAAGDQAFLRWAARWMRGSISKDALPRAYEILSETDVRQVLPAIRVPTLILHRTEDPVVPVDNGRYLAERIPTARYVEQSGFDHLPFLGDWESVAEEIEEFLTGARRARETERVLATILFADIVDSSGRATRLGDQRWRAVLERHDDLVSEEIARYSGKLVKTMGDGSLATFDGPARAIRCACRLRSKLAAVDLPMRFGIHTGEVEVRGEDLAGIAVHIGARVAATAEPGEVLVSGAVPPLVAGSGLRFEERGVHRLKGIEGDWPLFRVLV
ncbi:MAG TPA: adenylate/guanylate cyclase domain-containing protein [Actinomycetota bacterium]|nr:adenylate/guanylate cyclase domain-containing protein [Actinomycetota bacterium]